MKKKEWIVGIMKGDIKFRYSVSAYTKDEAIQLGITEAIKLGNDHKVIWGCWEDDWLSKEPFNGCCPE